MRIFAAMGLLGDETSNDSGVVEDGNFDRFNRKL